MAERRGTADYQCFWLDVTHPTCHACHFMDLKCHGGMSGECHTQLIFMSSGLWFSYKPSHAWPRTHYVICKLHLASQVEFWRFEFDALLLSQLWHPWSQSSDQWRWSSHCCEPLHMECPAGHQSMQVPCRWWPNQCIVCVDLSHITYTWKKTSALHTAVWCHVPSGLCHVIWLKHHAWFIFMHLTNGILRWGNENGTNPFQQHNSIARQSRMHPAWDEQWIHHTKFRMNGCNGHEEKQRSKDAPRSLMHGCTKHEMNDGCSSHGMIGHMDHRKIEGHTQISLDLSGWKRETLLQQCTLQHASISAPPIYYH